jgi:AraC-like DNA-binding protein
MNRYGLFLVCWLTVLSTWAQVRVEVTEYPTLSPSGSGLFIAGDFNDWNPGDVRFMLRRQPDGRFTLTLPDSLQQFEYKFTQGSWQLTEGAADGRSIGNRVFRRSGSRYALIRDTIAGWEQRPAYRFVVTEVPANTPQDATLYIAGTFNKWNAGDPRYKLRRQQDGTYHVTVYSDAPVLTYKFTRGSWDAVEGRESGKARPNRIATRTETGNQDIDVTIQSWEDLTSTFQFYSLYDLLMLFGCFQGLLLLIAIPSIQNYNRRANRWLVVLIGMASLFILLKVVGGYRGAANNYAKLLLVPDFIWFLYAPLFYFYIRRLLFDPGSASAQRPTRRWAYHFIPVAVQLLAYLPYFLMESKVFQLKLVNQDPLLRGLFLVTGLLALVFNLTYWFICRRTIRAYKAHYQTSISYEQNLQYLSTVLTIQAVCLTLWMFLYGLVAASRFITFDVLALAERNVDTIWLAFSTITYFLGYVAVHQPEIFKLPQPRPVQTPVSGFFDEVVHPLPEPVALSEADRPLLTGQEVPPLADKAVPAEADGPSRAAAGRPAPLPALPQLRESVATYMVAHKPYVNPNLTIHELAGALKMPPHVLSKVINEGFGKNFFDFINAYRVEEFKRRMDDPRAKQYTLLSLAFDVGFNSKTAFNRAFKKLTNQTPKDYFHMASEEQPL